MGSWHLNLCQIFMTTTLLLLPSGTVEKLLSWKPRRYWESLPWFHVTCPVSWVLHKEYGSVTEWALVYFCEQSLSSSFLFFHFTDLPAVLPSCSVFTGHSPALTPVLSLPLLLVKFVCCCCPWPTPLPRLFSLAYPTAQTVLFRSSSSCECAGRGMFAVRFHSCGCQKQQ